MRYRCHRDRASYAAAAAGRERAGAGRERAGSGPGARREPRGMQSRANRIHRRNNNENTRAARFVSSL